MTKEFCYGCYEYHVILNFMQFETPQGEPLTVRLCGLCAATITYSEFCQRVNLNNHVLSVIKNNPLLGHNNEPNNCHSD
jgi:hypothetical protein